MKILLILLVVFIVYLLFLPSKEKNNKYKNSNDTKLIDDKKVTEDSNEESHNSFTENDSNRDIINNKDNVEKEKTWSERKGEEGEEAVNMVLEKYKDDSYILKGFLYQVFSDKGSKSVETMIHSTQIDHIIINNRNVFVIETKNRQGKIKGKTGDREWIQEIDHNNLREKSYKQIFLFENPIKQNHYHIAYLHNIFKNNNIKGYNIINVVVFVNNSELEINETEKTTGNLNISPWLNDDFIIKNNLDNLNTYLSENIKPVYKNSDDIITILNQCNSIHEPNALQMHVEFLKNKDRLK